MPRHFNRAIKHLVPGTACSFVLQFPVNLKLPLTQLAKAQGTAGIHSGCANIKISGILCVTKAAPASAVGGVRLGGGGGDGHTTAAPPKGKKPG